MFRITDRIRSGRALRVSFVRPCASEAAAVAPAEPEAPVVPTIGGKKFKPRDDYTPRQMVEYLDKFIVGQGEAKKSVANALRARWRRRQLPDDMKNDVVPRNILMTGPTGCGKTEVARRLSKLVDAPFVKVEATKFTEVGFHGRDVDQIMRDLVEAAHKNMRKKMEHELQEQVEQGVESTILEALLGKMSNKEDRETWLNHLRSGSLEDRLVTIDVPTQQAPQQRAPSEITDFINELQREANQFVKAIRVVGSNKPRMERLTVSVREARRRLGKAEYDKMIKGEELAQRAVDWTEQQGIVFIDEIDKIVAKKGAYSGPDASAEGVQRDLLPLIEGTTIQTKYGNVKSEHVLFLGAGAFHSVKPADLLAELQGRLPVRVMLEGLTEKDLIRILTEPEFNMIVQNQQMMKTEGVDLVIEEGAVAEIARIAAELNHNIENIGARRLHTVLEKVMEDISYNAHQHTGQTVTITAETVREALGDMLKRQDLYRHIL
jgi:ATP-dependent HslUV protease ATP-binding subunit HslU